MSNTIRVALPKGRLAEETLKLFMLKVQRVKRQTS